jgi:hypothetical protein
MRDVSELPSGQEPVDRLLADAGDRWRARQPDPRPVEARLFAEDRGGAGLRIPVVSRGWSFVAGAATAAVVLVAVALAAPNLVPRLGGGVPVPPDATDGYIATGLANCPLTKPDGSFTPPAEPGADFVPPDGEAWYGSPFLWTLLDVDGEVWRGLPKSTLGLTQKTFWWRHGYRVQQEPRPEIYVTGRRLDGPGRFGFGPGTNASFGLGTAMLVGIDIPDLGCWELTGRYGNETLSYVVWVGD